MSDLPNNITDTSRRCPNCGEFFTPGQEQCTGCGSLLGKPIYPVTDPVKRPSMVIAIKRTGKLRFPPGATLVFQFLPFGQCVASSIDDSLALGRRRAYNGADFLDLTEFNGLEQGVSRRHCVLRRQDEHLLIRDLGSTNGTFLNGEQLKPNTDYKVAHGDRIILARLHMMIFFAAPEQG